MSQSEKVPVFSMRGKALMPCSPSKARRLMHAGKAVPVGGKPFAIRLTVASGETLALPQGAETGEMSEALNEAAKAPRPRRRLRTAAFRSKRSTS